MRNTGPRRPIHRTHRTMEGSRGQAGQQRPIVANSGQHRATLANISQHRPTLGNSDHRWATVTNIGHSGQQWAAQVHAGAAEANPPCTWLTWATTRHDRAAQVHAGLQRPLPQAHGSHGPSQSMVGQHSSTFYTHMGQRRATRYIDTDRATSAKQAIARQHGKTGGNASA